ncbi:MAG TPA: SRPBCC family protein [Steroidobacteraceae bacterium]|nr:SRPBCC family protein [Steroidobacteraceae bacterium]
MANTDGHSWDERRRQQSGERSAEQRSTNSDAVRLARALGWFSIGLGVAEIAASRGLGTLVGIQRPWTVRALGLRELAAGAAILTRPREPAFLWSRVAGDAMDLALLGAAFGARDAHRLRLTAALGSVGAVTAVDVLASRRLSAAVMGQHAAPVEISLSVGIDRSADELYRFWRDMTNLPRFMSSVREVRPLDGLPPEQARRWHWTATAPAGLLQWESEIIEERPAELISWRSRSGTPLASEGTVHFSAALNGAGTLVRLRTRYTGASGAATATVARLLRQLPRQQMKAELRRFKQLIETGEIATIDGQPAGPRSPMVRWFQRVIPATRKTPAPDDAGLGLHPRAGTGTGTGTGTGSASRWQKPSIPAGGAGAERSISTEGAQS